MQHFGVALLRILGYALSLACSVGTHRSVFGEIADVARADHVAHQAAPWSVGKAVGVLLASGGLVAWLSGCS